MSHPKTLANPPTRPKMPRWSVDWFGVTLTDSTDGWEGDLAFAATAIVNRLLLGGGEAPEAKWHVATGSHGYKRAKTMVDWPVKIEWAGTPDQGCHINMSGAACQRAAYMAGKSKVSWALWAWRQFGDFACPSMSRLDLALDTEDITPAFAYLCHARGALVTRLMKPPMEFSAQGQGGGTVYFGSRASEAFVRCYDKAGQLALGNDYDRKALAPWYRWEVEFKGERASRVMDTWDKNGWAGVAGLIDQTASFRAPVEGDANPSRWPLQDKWQEYLGVVPLKPERPPKSPHDVDIDTRLAYAAQQYGALLAQVMAERGHGAVTDWATEAAVQGTHGYAKKLARQQGKAVATPPVQQGVDS